MHLNFINFLLFNFTIFTNSTALKQFSRQKKKSKPGSGVYCSGNIVECVHKKTTSSRNQLMASRCSIHFSALSISSVFFSFLFFSSSWNRCEIARRGSRIDRARLASGLLDLVSNDRCWNFGIVPPSAFLSNRPNETGSRCAKRRLEKRVFGLALALAHVLSMRGNSKFEEKER